MGGGGKITFPRVQGGDLSETFIKIIEGIGRVCRRRGAKKGAYVTKMLFFLHLDTTTGKNRERVLALEGDLWETK